ncbi:hypothetical protein AAMO2058_001441300 [Amorphochlora amoebiformis]|uniref:Uncharacterized protein n=1 Tax=Amorphochlora amoebiformis TaxID=1561963 RepID=A0A7S0DG93_9EUKA|mmetsp:Transcript_26903/g.42685  ORF Transcript_26903/g.42685 Transcript_26903/m.42685 type:complete len:2018 (+) Transcript_26903:82-6135(+)
MPRVDAKGRDHGSFVLPANDPDGYNESFGRPEDVCDLTSLYLRHNKLKSKKIMGLAVSDNELGEFNLLVRFNHIKGMEDDVELLMYLAAGDGPAISEPFLLAMKKTENNKDFSRDMAAWITFTNIFADDLIKDNLHLIIQVVTVRPSLKCGGKRVAGVKFRQPYAVSVLRLPSRELMTMVKSWDGGSDGFEVETTLDMVMGPELKFTELPKTLMSMMGDSSKIQNVKGEISLTFSMWYGAPLAPTLPKDANFTQVQSLLQHFVVSSAQISKRKRLGDPSNPPGPALKRPIKADLPQALSLERKLGGRVMRIPIGLGFDGNSVPVMDTKSPSSSRIHRQGSGRGFESHATLGSAASKSIRRLKSPKSGSRRVHTESPGPDEKFVLDKVALRSCDTRGPSGLNFDFITVIPRRPLQTWLPMGEVTHGVFMTLGQLNTEKLLTKSMKKAPKNVLAKVTLRDNKTRQSYGGVIVPGLGKTITCQPEYDSLVYYHANSPQLNERFLMQLPPNFVDCHIHIEFFHCSSSKPPEPLGFTFIPLSERNSSIFVRDGEHTLSISKYSRKSGESDQTTNYLNAYTKKDLSRGTLILHSQLCSNLCSQDPRIHWFLNYDKVKNASEALKGILTVDLHSLQPLLSVVLDTVFTIFLSKVFNELHEPALEVLVFILGLTSNPDHKIPGLTTSRTPSTLELKDGKNGSITDRRLRNTSVFAETAPPSKSYIPVHQTVDHWIETKLAITTKGKGVAAVEQMMLQWRTLIEWSVSKDALSNTQNPKWRSVLLALRSCNMLMKVVLKLIPFGMSDEDCKASKVLKRVYEVRVRIREEVVRITKATSELISMKKLHFIIPIQKYVIDRAAVWLGSLLELFPNEEKAVDISKTLVSAVLKLSAPKPGDETPRKTHIPIGLHYLQFAKDMEQEGIFTAAGICTEMLLPILESLETHITSKKVGVRIICVEVLNSLLPMLITGIMEDDGTNIHKQAQAKKTRIRARGSNFRRNSVDLSTTRATRVASNRTRTFISSMYNRPSGHNSAEAATNVAVKMGFSNVRAEKSFHPRLKGVIKTDHQRLISLAAKLFPPLLKIFREIRSKEDSHPYAYYYDNNRMRLKEAQTMSCIAMIMMANLIRISEKPSEKFEQFLGKLKNPGGFLVELIQAATSLVGRPMFESSWIQMRLCVLKFVQGVMQQASAWAVRQLQNRPRDTTIDEIDESKEDDLGEAMDDFCKKYWRLSVNLLMCNDLQLERQPQRRAAYTASHVRDMREEIINDMREMQQTMGKSWARYHRVLFPPLLKTSIMLGERSGRIVRTMLFDLVLHLWKLHKAFQPALWITVDVATDLVMKLSQIRQTNKITRMNKAHELRNPRWCALGLCRDDIPWMSLAAQVKMHPLILSIQELFTVKLKSNLREYMVAESKALPRTIAALRVEKEGAIKREDYTLAQRLHDEITRLEKQELEQTSGDRQFIEQFNNYCRDIAQYFQFLVIAIRIPRSPQYEDDGIDVCVWLIQFLKRIEKKEQCSQVYDMFVQMHLKFQNGTEQGNALLEYAEFLSWEGKDQQKKLQLLSSAYKVFHTANSLAQCVQVCKRLALAHEMYSLKFMDVARTLRLQAQYFETLSKKDQITARYYRVFFVGRGLPAHLRGKSFVYRSGSATRLISVGEFTNQIKGFFPGAKVVNSTDPPKLKLVKAALAENYKWRNKELKVELTKVQHDLTKASKVNENLLQVKLQEISRALTEAEGTHKNMLNSEVGTSKEAEANEVKRIVEESPYLKIIQITTLTVSNTKVMEGKEHHLQSVDATMRHKRYHHEKEIKVFMYQRVLRPTAPAVLQYCKEHKCTVPAQDEKKRNEYRDLWVQRNYVIVQQPMPAVRRRVPIESVNKAMYTPLKNAIITLRDKNEEMKSAVLTAKESEERNDLVPLTQNLSGVIDAAVAGGIANYIAAFFDGSYIKDMPHEEPLIQLFKDTLEEQLEILKEGLHVFHSKLAISSNLKPLFQHLQGAYSKMIIQLAKGILKKEIKVKSKGLGYHASTY